MTRLFTALFAFSVLVLRAQTASTIDADMIRIFQQKAFATESFGPVSWLDSGHYTTIEASTAIPGAHDIVEYDALSGHRVVLVGASTLRPRESVPPLDVEDTRGRLTGAASSSTPTANGYGARTLVATTGPSIVPVAAARHGGSVATRRPHR